jgi:hypothetical protein
LSGISLDKQESYFEERINELRSKLTASQIEQSEKYLRILKIILNPRLPKTTRELVEYLVDGDTKNGVFAGPVGKGTLHENLFAWMSPELEHQVSFGTGKGGLKNFGCSKIVVDFYCREEKVAFEIDGESHKLSKQIEKDEFKERLLETKYGVSIFRYTNQEVEDKALFRLMSAFEFYDDLQNYYRFRGMDFGELKIPLINS